MKYKGVIFILTFFLFLSGCERIIPSPKIKEGIATFHITYETSKEENPIVILLPKKMITYFKHNNTAAIVEGFFSSFKMTLLTRYDLEKKFTIVRILDKKYIYQTNLDGIPFGSNQMSPMKIKFLDSTFSYKGLKCKAAQIFCPQVSPEPYLVYYTDEINIKDANINTPYYKIPGVLVKFKLKLFNVIMNIELENVRSQNITNDIFEVPKKDDYQYVSLKELEEILNKFQ